MPSRILSVLAVACLLIVGMGWSQDTRGSIVGRVTDPSGAVVPNAQVSVTNAAMGTKASLSTNQDGFYAAAFLQPGQYDLEAVAQGFKTAVRKGVTVQVSQHLEVNLTLEVGQSEQAVVVTGEAPLMFDGVGFGRHRHRLEARGGSAAVLRQPDAHDRAGGGRVLHRRSAVGPAI